MKAGIEGISHSGSGDINVQGVIGANGTYYASPHPSAIAEQRTTMVAADIGVITILSAETRAVIDMLRRGGDYASRSGDDGRRFYSARVGVADHPARVVATQAMEPGQHSVMVAFEQLRAYCAPSIVVLCGIAGAIHPDLRLGDVVIAREIVYYEGRKETPDGIRRRGEAHHVPAIVQHAVNAMFTEYGEPMPVATSNPPTSAEAYKALSGPIGTGEAVVADSYSDVREYLTRFNDKTLALETEAGGVAQAFYEQVTGKSSVRGWLAIRGISDFADSGKNDDYHDIASRNAAIVFERLLPFLTAAR